jgi:hypothetical protein
MFISGVNDTSDKLLGGVNNTGDKFLESPAYINNQKA